MCKKRHNEHVYNTSNITKRQEQTNTIPTNKTSKANNIPPKKQHIHYALKRSIQQRATHQQQQQNKNKHNNTTTRQTQEKHNHTHVKQSKTQSHRIGL